MCFGMNAGGDTCEHCNTKREDAGWSLWLKYEDLPLVTDLLGPISLDEQLKA